MTATEIEATAVHAPGTDLTPYKTPVLEEYRARFVMAPEEAKALDAQLRECMRAVLIENVDYGLIPGMGKTPSLFKPGAEKLLQWFGFGFDNKRDEIERDGDGKRIGVTYKCTVFKELADGRRITVATCEGYAGYDEDKFYVSVEANAAKERANAKKYKRDVNEAKFTEYRAPWNSVLKMAHKRALVGAAIDATAAAGLFTQDLEDLRGAAPDGNAFRDAAEAKIMALPDQARDALDAWYRGKKWPDPGQWTAEQWCAALMAAGAIAARQEAPPQSTVTPAHQPPPAAAAAKDEAWVDAAITRAAGETITADECRALWKESAAKVRAGDITKADATRIQDLLRARLDDLGGEAKDGQAAGPAQSAASALDPEDPWAVRVEALANADDAAEALRELKEIFGSGQMEQDRANRVFAAIRARFPQAADEARRAA